MGLIGSSPDRRASARTCAGKRALVQAPLLELSTKCKPGEAFQVAAEAKAFLMDRGVNLSGDQQTKTRTALEFYSKQLAA
jgi:hypothetical protein